MIILNSGPVPVRVAGRWLQPGEMLDVDPAVAGRLMAANPVVVESGSEPAKPDGKPTEDTPVIKGPSAVYEVTGEPPFRNPTRRKK